MPQAQQPETFLTPLSPEEFRSARDKLARDKSHDDLYTRLYLGLPKDLRIQLRLLLNEASKIREPNPSAAAVTALRLLGSPQQKRILADKDVQWAILGALWSTSNRVSEAMEALVDDSKE